MEGVAARFHRDRLADGRDIIYVDDADSLLPEGRKPDQRDLPPRPATAEMRQDVLTGEWISIAATRQNRVFLPPADQDPLAPQTPTNPSEVPDIYDVAVFENRSPSFGPDLTAEGSELDVDGIGFERTLPAIGRCEVVCFSPDHEGSFGTVTDARARTVLETWANRTSELQDLPGVKQVFVFENRGQEIGVTLPHPHGQIYAYPFVTPKTHALLRSIERVGPDFFGTLLAKEQSSERVIHRGEHFTVFVPFAARWPLEVHILPHRHVPDIASLGEDERAELAPLYRRVVRSLDALYDTPTPYIAAWHQAPVDRGRDVVRLMVQITSPRRQADKLKFLAGSEAAMGAFIADVRPESQAAHLRDAFHAMGGGA